MYAYVGVQSEFSRLGFKYVHTHARAITSRHPFPAKEGWG